MHGKRAIIVALFAVGCGQALEAAPGGAPDATSDVQTGSDAGQEGAAGDSAPGSDAGGDGASEDAIADAAASDSPHEAGMDAAAGTDAGHWSPDCPVAEPAPGDPCSVASVQCEYPLLRYLYKVEYDISCDDLEVCQGGGWAKLSIASQACVADGVNSMDCPARFDDIRSGGSCPGGDKGLRCEYPAMGVCTCSGSLGGPVMLLDAGGSWTCNPTPAASCPMPRPRLGSSCPAGQAACTYETCEYEEYCAASGIWQARDTLCAEPGASP
jgi:hypothetical protein